ncbi:MAG: DNA photolyase [Candidatus Latescibacteria bacterium]|nr:DNA photolyase [Candidatus Latescibacterota bacterium]
MFDFIYIEEAVRHHPRTQALCQRFAKATRISCQRYGEVFNRRGQNFRLQKQRPALILAAKHGRRVLETPVGYGIGGRRNFYFSHMLNCPYDCRYCFLQGMYRSAHLVVFVNFEDFQRDIDHQLAASDEPAYFFSGYDCDSLAFDRVTGFASSFLPFFQERPQAWLELRTKSVQIRALLKHQPLANTVVACSLTPEAVASQVEEGTPPVARRLEALAQLQAQGWPIGLRFDPLIWCDDFEEHYRRLFAQTFAAVAADQVHSVSLGAFRLPRPFYQTIQRLYPSEPLLAAGLEDNGSMISYSDQRERQLHDFCAQELRRYIGPERFFPCPNRAA